MPTLYEVTLAKSAEDGLAALDRSEQIQVVKQLEKLKRAPELGEALGNKTGLPLTGYRKLYAARKRIRIIYTIQREIVVVLVVAIGPREDAKVYKIAEAEAARRLRRIG
jgi:mRNA interferase RelE/StbE